jgi:hypothetical protein
MNLRTGAAFAAVLLLASCTQGTQGIFASIEREQKVKSNGGLSKVATVSHMAELPGATPPTTSTYFIAGGGALFHRTHAETKWHSSSITYNGKLYSRFVAVGTVASSPDPTLYVVANRDATDSDLVFSSTDGENWTPVTLPDGSGTTPVVAEGLIPIRKDDGYSSDELLLTVTESSGTNQGAYDVVYRIDATNVLTQIILPGTTTPTDNGYVFPVRGAAVTGGNYYFIGNDGLYWWAAGPSATSLSATQGAMTDIKDNGFSDILLLASNPLPYAPAGGGTQVVLSSTKGAMYWGTLSGGTWTWESRKTGITGTGGDTAILGKMLYQNSTTPAYVWVGTGNGIVYPGAGFVSLSAADLTVKLQAPAGTDKDNYNSTVLPTSQVLMFFRTSDGDFYLGTGAEGLWKWTFPARTWSQQ